eukprot:m.396690 g.396690  ORF g.396690 m.396690 type:complete len:756 (+) comp21114_c0_seq4:60-2327(+)
MLQTTILAVAVFGTTAAAELYGFEDDLDKLFGGPPPPPAPPAFGFNLNHGNWMVLQQAPAKSAVYGTLGVGGTAVKVSMCADNGGAPCNTIDAKINATHQPVGYQDPNGVPFPVTASWKALLPPMPAGGSFTITATCTGCTDVNKTITLTNVTFGDMWYCSGQSNMWLPVQYSFSRNESLAAVQAGKYNNIRGIFAPSATTYQLGNQWMTARQAASDGTTENPTYSLFQMGATCWYFAQKLAESGVTTPIGIADTAIGGQRIEEYMDNSSIGTCSNRSGETSPLSPWDGQLFAKLVIPFVDMTVKGWVWYQGENNMGAVKGSSTHDIGYSCEQRVLVEGWRKIWSDEPGTTDPMAPFGVVTLASSGAEGADNAMGAMRVAQTAGYGVLPNPAMPNTFMAQAYDLDDQWGPAAGPCFSTWQCCSKTGGPIPPPPPGPPPPNTSAPINCHQSDWLVGTDFHTGVDLGTAPGKSPGDCCTQCSSAPLLKKGCKFFTFVNATSTAPSACWFKRSNGGQRHLPNVVSGSIYPPGSPPPPSPPKCTPEYAEKCKLACSAAADTVTKGGIHPRDKKPVGDRLGTAAFNLVYGGKASYTGPTLSGCAVSGTTLSVSFNSSLLRGDHLVLQNYTSGLSFFEVQTEADDFCLEPRGGICPTWAGGTGKPTNASLDGGWVSLDIKLSSDGSMIEADLTPLAGKAPTAVRYAWNCINCCDPQDPNLYVTHPCGPASCPIMGSSIFPANPFLAKIVGGKCSCVPPQVC